MNTLVKKVLTQIGIRPERFSLQWASAAEAPRFVRLITEFTKQIEKLGPLGEAEGIAPDDLKQRLEKGLEVLSDRKVRMFFGNATKTIRKEGNFTQKSIDAVIDDKLTQTLTSAFEGKAGADSGEEPKKKSRDEVSPQTAPKVEAKTAPTTKKQKTAGAKSKKTASPDQIKKAAVPKKKSAAKKKK